MRTGVTAATEAHAASEMPGFEKMAPSPIVRADGSEAPAAGQLAAVVSYDGTNFAGFAKQPGLITVQGTLERAFGTALHRPVQTVCAGRTDAGVHARGQVVNLPLTADELSEHSLFRLRRSANALSGDAIAIRSLTAMPVDYSARFDAYEREYRYFIVPGAVPPVFLRRFAWHVGSQLDADAMQLAARLLEGEHDFKSFCLAASAKDRNTVRTVHSIDVTPFEMFGEQGLCVRVVGNAFLHSMIRAIVGTLVLVGRGKRAPEWVPQVLEARNRQAAGENAPACGLVFWRVTYKDGVPS
jgi:tRNA pseudouridine38-40 synthase